MVTVYDDQSAREVLSVEDYSYSLQNEILEGIAGNRSLRIEAMRVDVDLPSDPHYAVLDSYVAAKVPDDFGYLLRVCNLGDLNDYCKMPPVIFYATLDSDVFVEETVISAEVGDGGGEEEYSPKKIKMFFWEGGFPEDYCRDECEDDRAPLFCSSDFTKVLRNGCENFDSSDSCLESGTEPEVVDVCGTNEQCMDGECVVSLFRKLVCPKRDYVLCDYCKSNNPCGGYAGGWDSGSCDHGDKDEWTCYNFAGAWESDCLPVTEALPGCPATLSGCAPSSRYPAMRFYEPVDSRVESCICLDTIWTPTDTSQVCSTELVHQTSNCERTRDIAGTKDCTCVPVWSPLPSTVCAGVSFPQTNTCNSATQQAVGTKNCVASLSATFTITTTEQVYDSIYGCFYNKCYYQVSASNSGEASGVVWKRVVSDGFEQVYNQVVNPGTTIVLGQGWSPSECDVSLPYSVSVYDDKGAVIGGTSFTCAHP